eukprot:TRINITY_DN46898_c0_g1_i1.p1 TRINITY_DN46898_c0_g1~~TRINITY_DN46898_c0_g1_i1.p1  ORF type:complete len:338 (+),score=56.73 TRINITY_DN46898_c0_g1_i1:141-1016(+)
MSLSMSMSGAASHKMAAAGAPSGGGLAGRSASFAAGVGESRPSTGRSVRSMTPGGLHPGLSPMAMSSGRQQILGGIPDASGRIDFLQGQRSASVPSLRNAAGTQERAPQWISASGTGGYHFPALGDDHEHGLHEARHEASEARKWLQRRKLQAEHQQRSLRLLEHKGKQGLLSDHDASLVKYDINGRVYNQSVAPVPHPAQAPGAHWLCQVNGMTNEYNIVTNMPAHPRNVDVRRKEVDTLRRTMERGEFPASAGNIQPQRVIDSYETINYPPVWKRNFTGVMERHYNIHL